MVSKLTVQFSPTMSSKKVVLQIFAELSPRQKGTPSIKVEPIITPGRGTPQSFWWKRVARTLKPVTYFRQKSVIFFILFQTWAKNRSPSTQQSNIWWQLTRIALHLHKHLTRATNLAMLMRKNSFFETKCLMSNQSEKLTLSQTKICTLFHTKTTQKPYPLGPYIPI